MLDANAAVIVMARVDRTLIEGVELVVLDMLLVIDLLKDSTLVWRRDRNPSGFLWYTGGSSSAMT